MNWLSPSKPSKLSLSVYLVGCISIINQGQFCSRMDWDYSNGQTDIRPRIWERQSKPPEPWEMRTEVQKEWGRKLPRCDAHDARQKCMMMRRRVPPSHCIPSRKRRNEWKMAGDGKKASLYPERSCPDPSLGLILYYVGREFLMLWIQYTSNLDLG